MPAKGDTGLVPLFRSSTQFRILGELATQDREWSVRDLSGAVDAPYATVWREVDRLRKLGLLTERRAGSAVQVSWNEVVHYAPILRRLMQQTYGPLPLLAEEVGKVEGVVDAFMYGSWARRFAGELGPAPRDIDVMVLLAGSTDPIAVYQACTRVGEETGQVVNPTVLTADDWTGDTSAFADEVRQGVRVGLLGDDYGTTLA